MHVELRSQNPSSLFSAPVHPFSNTTMSLPLIPLLQRQLETTLQLLISALPAMSTDDVMLVRIRLNEADIVIGNAVVDRSDSTANGDLIPTL